MPASELMGHENGCEERYEVCKYCWRAARATCQSLRPVLLARCRISHLSMCSTPLLAMKVRLRDLDEHERRQCADRPVECQYCQRAFVQLPLCAHHNPWLPRCCASLHARCMLCMLPAARYAEHPTLHAASRTLHAARISLGCMLVRCTHASGASVRLLSQVDNGTFRRGRTQYCRANGEGHAVTCP